MMAAFILWAGMALFVQDVRVHELEFPENVVSGGVVVAEIEVSAGSVEAVQITHGEEPFSTIARESLRQWVFPGLTKTSALPIIVAFRTPFLLAAGSNRYRIPVARVERDQGLFPENIAEPVYPVNMSVAGNVVLALQINGEGRVTDSKVVQGLAGLTDACRDAVAAWKFRPIQTKSPEQTAPAFAVCVFRTPVLGPVM